MSNGPQEIFMKKLWGQMSGCTNIKLVPTASALSIYYFQLNVNGCSYVPNTLFNEAACNIHDLCYITPGASKQDCDDTFVTNIVR